MDRSISGQPGYETAESGDNWFMGYETSADVSTGIKTKLSDSAEANGLVGPDYVTKYADSDAKVFMRAR
ncbi:hypothetical protein [Aminivibrio pyruvatiphilus]|uniref:hypothetical protein n=1 Tax=Aminivibrio pyruvatiphilus TaxID=1005740 RepID=UPI001AB05F96|nr:hypothetical protein [Aminivibrio pyruvatiphilus]